MKNMETPGLRTSLATASMRKGRCCPPRDGENIVSLPICWRIIEFWTKGQVQEKASSRTTGNFSIANECASRCALPGKIKATSIQAHTKSSDTERLSQCDVFNNNNSIHRKIQN